ncbi:diaminopropionate ammonia-lyase protein (plasmid) [Rhizobium sp. CIAT894]|uniref:diaminopropionate ammonia-lyase n=1 Tax=Rhizobium sp. CIAT894 TaxID=2020312 RepID=UPI000A1DA573|nr:diaminopropionate ammonia-lyase [Rhizobium sp. CIAT894]ARM92208.1 diaminopropionate ammonia-lyase protein [Rhizobium sp. CIAT894]
MLLLNENTDYRKKLDPSDAETLSLAAAEEVERFLNHREGHRETPLVSLSQLADKLDVASIHLKDEGHRLGLGSFKALGGSYAVIRLVLEEASREFGREVDVSELHSPEVKTVAHRLTVACATDGNHGRSVAQGAQLVGANCAIFVHSGVSAERIAAIARFGAEIIRVEGNYDESVAEASRVASEKGWQTVSDTSWPGYERIPGFVMQGYTALLRETVRQIPERPTHVFIQSGVGGIAAAVAGYFTLLYGDDRPFFTVVDPSRAACLVESARAGKAVKIEHGEPTVMAMLECYEPSLVAWRILSRSADAFMTVEEEEAVGAMRRLANPEPGDPAVVSGESGGVGLAALIKVSGDQDVRSKLKLGKDSRILLVNTEGATDPALYQQLVGASPEDVAARSSVEMAGAR